MTRDDVVLVGVDGSAASLHALDWAAAQARAHGWARPAGLQLLAAVVHGGLARRRVRRARRHRDPGGRQGRARRGDRSGSSSMGVPVTRQGAHGRRRGRARRHVAHRPARGRRDARSWRVRGPAAGHRLVGPARARVLPDRRRPAAGGRQDASRRRADPADRGPCSGSSWASTARPQAEHALRYAIGEAEAWGAELTAVAGVPVGSMTGVLAWLPAAVDHEQVLRDVTEGLQRRRRPRARRHPGPDRAAASRSTARARSCSPSSPSRPT